MSFIIKKAKSLFRRSSKSSITSTNGAANLLIRVSSEDVGMAVASKSALGGTELQIEEEKKEIEEKEDIKMESQIEPQPFKPLEKGEIRVRDFAYETTPVSMKATATWNPCKALATYDWCLFWKKDLELYLCAMDMRKLVHIGWLSVEEISGFPQAEELLSRVSEDDLAKEYKWSVMQMEKPTTTERVTCARESKFPILRTIRYPRKSLDTVRQHLRSVDVSNAQNIENQPPSSATTGSTSGSSSSARGRNTDTKRIDCDGTQTASAAGTRRKRDDSPSDEPAKTSPKRIRIYGRTDREFDPANPPNAGDNKPLHLSSVHGLPTSRPKTREEFYKIPSTREEFYKVPSTREEFYNIPNSVNDDSRLPWYLSTLDDFGTSDTWPAELDLTGLPERSFEYARRVEERRKFIYNIGMRRLHAPRPSTTASPSSLSSSKKRSLEEPDVSDNAQKRARTIHDVVNEDMLDYVNGMTALSRQPTEITCGVKKTTLNYIPHESEAGNSNAKGSTTVKSVFGHVRVNRKRPVIEPLRRHESFIEPSPSLVRGKKTLGFKVWSTVEQAALYEERSRPTAESSGMSSGQRSGTPVNDEEGSSATIEEVDDEEVKETKESESSL